MHPLLFILMQILKHKISVLEASNLELRCELQQTKSACEHFAQAAIDSQVFFFFSSNVIMYEST